MVHPIENKVQLIFTILAITFILINSSGCISSPSDQNDKKKENDDTLLINGGQSWPYNALLNSPEKFSCSLSSGMIPIGEFQWDFGDGTKNVTTSGEITYIYSIPGTKILKVTYKSDNGGKVLEAEIEIRVIETSPVLDVIYGEASYYGDGRPYGGSYDGIEDGSLTASGEPYDSNGYTAATWEIFYGVPVSPLNGGTELLVTNVENGKSIQIRVNDRGPFHFPYDGTPEINTMMDSNEFYNENLTFVVSNYERHYTGGRVIDLTPRAFSELDVISKGVIEVRIEVI